MSVKMPSRQIGLSIRFQHNRSHSVDRSSKAADVQNHNLSQASLELKGVLGGVIE